MLEDGIKKRLTARLLVLVVIISMISATRQIPMVNKVYEPTKKEIENAKNVENAIKEAKLKGSGVISMNGQMVDRPVVLRAERVMRLAKASNLIDEEGNYIEK